MGIGMSLVSRDRRSSPPGPQVPRGVPRLAGLPLECRGSGRVLSRAARRQTPAPQAVAPEADQGTAPEVPASAVGGTRTLQRLRCLGWGHLQGGVVDNNDPMGSVRVPNRSLPAEGNLLGVKTLV